jgi:hypothetical protein
MVKPNTLSNSKLNPKSTLKLTRAYCKTAIQTAISNIDAALVTEKESTVCLKR